MVLNFTDNKLSERLQAGSWVMTLWRPIRLLVLLPGMFLAPDALLIDRGWLIDRMVVGEIRSILMVSQIWERPLRRARAIVMDTVNGTMRGVRANGGILGVRASELWIGRRIIRTSEWCSLPSQVDLTTENGRVSAMMILL